MASGGSGFGSVMANPGAAPSRRIRVHAQTPRNLPFETHYPLDRGLVRFQRPHHSPERHPDSGPAADLACEIRRRSEPLAKEKFGQPLLRRMPQSHFVPEALGGEKIRFKGPQLER